MPLAQTVNLDGAPTLSLSRESLDELAHLALALSQRDVEMQGVRPAASMVPYEKLDGQGKSNARATVYRVVQALVMLGYIENPT